MNIFDAMRHRSPVVRTDIVARNVGFAFIQVLFADFCWFEEAAGVSFSPLKGSKLPDLPGIFWLMVSTLNLEGGTKKTINQHSWGALKPTCCLILPHPLRRRLPHQDVSPVQVQQVENAEARSQDWANWDDHTGSNHQD